MARCLFCTPILVAGEGRSVEVLHAHGETCPRCWNFRELGGDPAHPEVCGRCATVLGELGL